MSEQIVVAVEAAGGRKIPGHLRDVGVRRLASGEWEARITVKALLGGTLATQRFIGKTAAEALKASSDVLQAADEAAPEDLPF